jgi:hypothetical protein
MLSIRSHQSIKSASSSRQSFVSRRFVVVPRATRNETPEQAFARRMKETEQYSERVQYVSNKKELEKVV